MLERNLSDPPLHMTVYTKNGKETRPIAEVMKQLVNYRGIPEYVHNPVLRDGERIQRTADGRCLIVEHYVNDRSFVTAVRYEWDYQQVKRIVEYADGHTYESHVPGMPTKEEFQMEIEIYGATARIEANGF